MELCGHANTQAWKTEWGQQCTWNHVVTQVHRHGTQSGASSVDGDRWSHRYTGIGDRVGIGVTGRWWVNKESGVSGMTRTSLL